jgi:general secretion pathway protein N
MNKRILGVFASAYLLTLLITAPASLLDLGLQYASAGKLLLANANGTVWAGQATPALRTQDGRLINLPLLHWTVQLPSILTGKIVLLLQWDERATEAIVSLNQIELRHAQFALPALLLGEASNILKPMELRGQLQIKADNLLFSSHGMQGSALVDWQQASTALTGSNTLGDYRMKLIGANERIHIELNTISGRLLLEGEGNWQAAKGLDFHGKAQASAGNYDNLTELLHHLGPEVSKGVHTFNFVQH